MSGNEDSQNPLRTALRADLRAADDAEAARRTPDMEMNIFDAVRDGEGNPVTPVKLKPEDRFCFSCHREVACWNKCCHGADITLTPGDILRLSKRLIMSPKDFLAKYTLPALWEKADMPVAKLRMKDRDGNGPCMFMRETGCAVYKDRPETCRLYPLGLATAKMKHDAEKKDFHFVVKEAHCEGHAEAKDQAVNEFLQEQDVGAYAEIDRGWMDILMKVVSWKVVGGPMGRDISPQTKQMFFLVSTNAEGFRDFVFGTKFLQTYDIDPDVIEILKSDDRALLKLGFDWLKNVMFNDPTISLKQDVLQKATARARKDMGAM